jgi:hypothetical protein
MSQYECIHSGGILCSPFYFSLLGSRSVSLVFDQKFLAKYPHLFAHYPDLGASMFDAQFQCARMTRRSIRLKWIWTSGRLLFDHCFITKGKGWKTNCNLNSIPVPFIVG